MDNLLLEIGVEEIPAGYIEPALQALSELLLQKLTDARIGHGDAGVFGTPRRLAVLVEKVARKQAPLTTELIGPPAKIGFDAAGKPTVAASKFAAKAGVAVSKLVIKETAKGAYLCAGVTERGKATRTLLRGILPEVILATPFPKTMRWADLSIAFARPIHSILVLLGSDVIPFEMGNLKSGRYTAGHSFMRPKRIKLASCDEYRVRLKDAYVMVDLQERKAAVRHEITAAAEKLGGTILPDEQLVDIVNNLVEYPVAVAGKFDDQFLELPDEVLITAMREHQKYFAVVDAHRKLMPCFVAVNNTAARDMARVSRGHERVLRARLADAQFFYRSDLEVTNDERVEKLKRVLFQAQLGSMYEKTERVARLAGFIAEKVDFGLGGQNGRGELKSQVMRAARLCKSDLVSQVVVEFPKLQGIMGRVYAAIAGELPTVGAAIEEHYQPTYSGGPLPKTIAGAILSIADKIDSIDGCFSAGLIPTGASDPYALRRQGIGLVQIMNDKGFAFSLKELIRQGLSMFDTKMNGKGEALSQKVYTFLQNRITRLLVEEGFSKDVVAAVVSVSVDDVPGVWARARALATLKLEPDFEPLVVTFKRVANIIKKSGGSKPGRAPADVTARLFAHDSEAALLDAYQVVEKKVAAAVQQDLFDEALVAVASLRDPIDRFFDGVMVMAEDRDVRHNRLALLGHIAALFENLADFSKLSS